MTHTVSHATAKALKSAGFPEAKRREGQIYFHEEGCAHLILKIIEWSGFCQTAFVFDGVAALPSFSPFRRVLYP